MARAIVVGVDGLDDAVAVATQAGSLGERLDLRCVLAHVVEDQPGFRHGMATEHERRAQERRTTEMLASRHRAPSQAEHAVRFGEAADALVRLAADSDAALIAVGSRGQGPLKSALIGSVSLTLATRSGFPVLVVPPGAIRDAPASQSSSRAIVCGVDGSEEADRAVQAAADLARALGLRLVLAHARAGPGSLAVTPSARAGAGAQINHHAELVERQQETGERTLERAVRLAAGTDRDLDLDTRLEAGDSAELLEQVATEEDAALIAVGSRGLGAIQAALMGSTSARLVGLAVRPVLIVPPGARLAPGAVAADGGG